MENLKASGNRIAFRTAAESKAIQVELYYSVGGCNYFTGGSDARGIYLSIMPVEFRDGCMSCILGQGTRACLVPLGRKSDKKLAATAIVLDKYAPEAARLYEAGDVAGAFALMTGALISGGKVCDACGTLACRGCAYPLT